MYENRDSHAGKTEEGMIDPAGEGKACVHTGVIFELAPESLHRCL